MKLQDIIIWILFIISLIMFFWYIFGSSLTFEQTILIFILTLLVKNMIETRGIKTQLTSLRNSFVRLADDFKEHIKHKTK